MLLNRNVHTASMEAGKAGRMHVHVQPRSEFICHSCSLSRDCQEMSHSASRTFVECSEQPGKSYNHPVVTPSRPAVGPTWKGPHAHTDCLAVRSPPGCQCIPGLPIPSPEIHPASQVFPSIRQVGRALPSGGRGWLPAGGPRQRAKCLCATWRGLQPSRPSTGTSANVLRPINRCDGLVQLSGSVQHARVQHSTHQHSTHSRSPEQRDHPE